MDVLYFKKSRESPFDFVFVTKLPFLLKKMVWLWLQQCKYVARYLQILTGTIRSLAFSYTLTLRPFQGYSTLPSDGTHSFHTKAAFI